MPSGCQPGDGQAWLRGIDLPGMDVERARRPAALTLAQRGADETAGEQPKKRATRRGEPHTRASQCGRGNLCDAAGGTLDPVGVSASGRVAVTGTSHRKEAGIVPVAFLDQDIERPFPALHDREVWGA